MTDQDICSEIVRLTTGLDTNKTNYFIYHALENKIMQLKNINAEINHGTSVLQLFVNKITSGVMPEVFLELVHFMICNGANFGEIDEIEDRPFPHYLLNRLLTHGAIHKIHHTSEIPIECLVLAAMIKADGSLVDLKDKSGLTLQDYILSAEKLKSHHDKEKLAKLINLYIPFSLLINDDQLKSAFHSYFDQYRHACGTTEQKLLSDKTWNNHALLLSDGTSLWSNTQQKSNLLCNYLHYIIECRPDALDEAITKIVENIVDPGKKFAQLICDLKKVKNEIMRAIASNVTLSKAIAENIDQCMNGCHVHNLNIDQGAFSAALKHNNNYFVIIAIKIMQRLRTAWEDVADNAHGHYCSYDERQLVISDLKSKIAENTPGLNEQGVDVSPIITQLRSAANAWLSPASKTILHKYSPALLLGYEGKLVKQLQIQSADLNVTSIDDSDITVQRDNRIIVGSKLTS